MTTVDSDRFLKLLGRIEAGAEPEGWDKPAKLYVIYDASIGDCDQQYQQMPFAPVIRLGTYAAALCIPPYLFSSEPAHALFRWALNLAEGGPAVAPIIKMLRTPGLLGFAFQFEGWSKAATKEQREQYNDVDFATVAGSREVRAVVAVDIGPQYYQVGRIRGDQPTSLLFPPGKARGAIAESLFTSVAVMLGLPIPPIKAVPVGWTWDKFTDMPVSVSGMESSL